MKKPQISEYPITYLIGLFMQSKYDLQLKEELKVIISKKLGNISIRKIKLGTSSITMASLECLWELGDCQNSIIRDEINDILLNEIDKTFSMKEYEEKRPKTKILRLKENKKYDKCERKYRIE